MNNTSLLPIRLELEVLDNVPFGTTNEKKIQFQALTLKLPENLQENAPSWLSWNAGQFVMLRPKNWRNEIISARPFSIARVSHQGLVLFFQTVGEGTKQIATLTHGDKVIVWGPLGNGFTMQDKYPTLLVAGGIGIVPFMGYTEQHKRKGNLQMLFSHRIPSESYPLDTIAQTIDVQSFYEQNSSDLDRFLSTVKTSMLKTAKNDGLVLACGPMPLLKYVWHISQEHSVKTQISLENKMSCGVGACLGCVAKTSMEWPDQFKAGLPIQTCTSGPVFWAHEIDLS